jgi:hypothetical protein
VGAAVGEVAADGDQVDVDRVGLADGLVGVVVGALEDKDVGGPAGGELAEVLAESGDGRGIRCGLGSPLPPTSPITARVTARARTRVECPKKPVGGVAEPSGGLAAPF